ncbi:MAG: tyrosine-type recombinase/integrase, partial [Ruminococcus sp.]|nr:tyrosine-type recombinase/integrase [Ruminococcus sp.]
ISSESFIASSLNSLLYFIFSFPFWFSYLYSTRFLGVCRLLFQYNTSKSDCHLEERYVDIVASKTSNGIRKVPIADKTLAYWEYFMTTEGDYLLNMDGRNFSKDKGYHAFSSTYWKPFMETLGMPDRDIHETRHTCSTLLHEAEIYEPKINRILGHTGKTTAENVYTHLDIRELVEAINKI